MTAAATTLEADRRRIDAAIAEAQMHRDDPEARREETYLRAAAAGLDRRLRELREDEHAYLAASENGGAPR